MNIVVCDKCKEEFPIKLKEEEVKDRISKVYFVCPYCDKEYISFYTSVLIKIKQNKIKQIQEKYENVKGKDYKQATRLYKQYEKLKKEIGKDIDNLRKRIEASTK